MPTRLDTVVVRAEDPARLAGFWSAVLGWPILDSSADRVTVGVHGAPPWSAGGPASLEFVPGATPRDGKNAVHLDLASSTLVDQHAIVERLRSLGSQSIDIGQEETPWVVMADPEGNELCVLEPREAYRDVGPVAAVVLDCTDVVDLANFWIKATGWPAKHHSTGFAALCHPRAATTWLELLEAADPPAPGASMLISLAPAAGGDLAAEAARLERAGARRVQEHPSDPTVIAMTDPDGHELRLHRPAGVSHQPT